MSKWMVSRGFLGGILLLKMIDTYRYLTNQLKIPYILLYSELIEPAKNLTPPQKHQL